jgi:hypothetical protein
MTNNRCWSLNARAIPGSCAETPIVYFSEGKSTSDHTAVDDYVPIASISQDFKVNKPETLFSGCNRLETARQGLSDREMLKFSVSLKYPIPLVIIAFGPDDCF